jgi:5-methylcytosine-specific restriction endonuclease McrA
MLTRHICQETSIGNANLTLSDAVSHVSAGITQLPQKKRRTPLPSRQAITEHWIDRIAELGVFDCSQDELPEGCCWACGRPGLVQRCHIKSHQHGGADTVDNLALLCPGCHAQSEDLPASAFLPWIRAMRRDVWQDEFTHVGLKLNRLGYTRDVFDGMVELVGADATVDAIVADWCADPATAAKLADRIKTFTD